MKTRVKGYYWVKWRGEWMVAEWAVYYSYSVWFICGDQDAYKDSDFEAFGELILHETN